MEAWKSTERDDGGNSGGKENDVFGLVMGTPLVHSQVKKIKREEKKKTDVDFSAGRPELRPARQEISRQKSQSRSPLGPSGWPISVGDPL
ncbi:hypothetical protein SAY86_014622 [Trapa natans]|uniref:Uncharacterized protein n=1 Tax=Trapa natans TaxID=22666 RepID=A0AAN7KGU6_TRANT|nr:hypothetical protein SAY86_014622 [Trapa natans]